MEERDKLDKWERPGQLALRLGVTRSRRNMLGRHSIGSAFLVPYVFISRVVLEVA